jgi:hypothetical protein
MLKREASTDAAYMLAWYNHTTLRVGRLKQQLSGDGNDDMSRHDEVCLLEYYSGSAVEAQWVRYFAMANSMRNIDLRSPSRCVHMAHISFQMSRDSEHKNPVGQRHLVSHNEEAKAAQKKRGCELARRVVVLKFSAPIDLRPKLPRLALAPQRERFRSQQANRSKAGRCRAAVLRPPQVHNLPHRGKPCRRTGGQQI